ncbi:MAG TPA: 3-dehydroquinate synthase [Chloroflexi bacterium]|nr:3-dehydroquinate synthase [Chloroflexota bacterium]
MNSNPNIVITGFMGTGKSTVGPRVAAALGRQFVDLDALIVARAGREIAQIFADDGVVAFRQLEAAAVDEVAAQRGLVVATGGGSLVSARNRRALASSGILVCLRARPEVLEARLSGASDRPLLHAEDRRARLRELLAGRAHAYDLIPHQVDTTSRSVDEVVAAIVGLAESALPEPTAEDEPVRLTVRVAGAEYPIVFDHADQLGALLRDRRLTGRLAIITNASVGPLHALPLQADLAVAGLEAEVLTVPDGEQYKTLATAEGLYTQLLERGFDRSSAVVALGGGVIGDLSGFVAATYMRGLPFVQVPTSLLAMVDASVGGKVAVDHPRAKNLIGAFKQPAAVLIDTHFLTTLPRREWRNGLAEVVKHGLIGAPALFERLETAATDALAADREFVREAVQVKIAVVEEDPFEHGRRTTLNLGHTFAHAFEVLSDFKIAHGEAVAIGLVAAARLSAELGHAAPALPDRVEALLRRLGLPTAFDHAAPEAVWQVMQGDKKKVGRRLRFVLVREVGEVFVTDQVPEAGVYCVLVGLKRR